MSERDLIRLILGLAGPRPDWLNLDVGDDSAVIRVPGDCRLALTMDSVFEGVHFEPGTPMSAVGYKAVARAVSDIAAMAARPLCALAAVGFPSGADGGASRALISALWEAAEGLSVRLIGGDVASGAERLSVTVTALGTPGPAGVIARAGARPGDALCVTGRLGGSLLGRHLTFRPRVPEALALVERCDVHAMIDVSDGLSTDALHLAEAGGVGVRIRADAVPVSEDAGRMAGRTGRTPLWHALNDGEDYELLFCASRESAARLAADGGLGSLPVTVVGEVIEGADSSLIMADGSAVPLRPGGWEHLTA
ncbi:MAG: thiamine-monophosphate kinase [Candidatus Brocadiaceae bacterium]|nr:thiamine-monophosphate kinase [Candidatus Brocadiaceae bacterium]